LNNNNQTDRETLLPIVPNLANLQMQHQLIKDTLYPMLAGNPVAHLDFPCYLNIGDLLIDAGISQFILDHKIECLGRYCALETRFFQRDRFPVETTLLLQGGGNFGDLYPLHNNFRKLVLEQYPENNIIFLPQSVHYRNDNHFYSDAEAFNRHAKLLICARDQVSYDYLAQRITTDKLCLLPDMALCIVDILAKRKPGIEKKLIFRRRDIEVSQEALRGENLIGSFDWEDIITEKEKKQMRRYASLLRKSKWRLIRNIVIYKHRMLRDQLIQRAVQHFLKYNAVDTDRLHGLILAQLLNRSVIMRDNSYNKLSNYVETWL